MNLTVLEFDFRTGGAYRFAYDVPHGQRMVVSGTFRTIEATSLIVFSWLIEHLTSTPEFTRRLR